MWLRGVLLLVVVSAVLASPAPKKGCPKACQCSSRLVQCTSLDLGKFGTEVYNLKISSSTPIALTSGIFKQLGLESLNFLHVENTTISSIEPSAFDGLFGLNTMAFHNCKLPSIEKLDTTSIAPTLKKLIFENTDVSGFEMLKLGNLEELEVSNCNLTQLPLESFSNMPDLSFISLSNNLIKSFDAATFTKLPSLSELKMTFNQISEIPEGLFSNDSELSSINFSNNPITKVHIKSASLIEELLLKSCEIDEFTGGEYLDKLASLDLSKNNLDKIPSDTFNKMEYLEYLDLSNNNLQTLDSTLFTNNSRLLKINLDNNDLKAIPKFTTVDDHFQTFYFSCNNCLLDDLEEDVFENFPGVVTLSLSNNNLKTIKEKVFQKLRSLIELDLSYNQISEFQPATFTRNPALSVLVLSGNFLSEIDTQLFAKNSGLKNLDVSNGQLSRLWKQPARELPSLKVLNAANNRKITSITRKDLEVTKKLDALDISGIALECTSDLKDAIKWLTKHDVASSASMKRTHESMVSEMEVAAEDGMSWEALAKVNCPDDNDEYYDEDEAEVKVDKKEEEAEEEEDDDDELDDKIDEMEKLPKVVINVADKATDDYDESDYDVESDAKLIEEIIASSTSSEVQSHAYLWPTLVFLATSVIVLIICSIVILMCIKRRASAPSLTLSHVQILPWSSGSTIKKHSGSVYRPLSEEKLDQPLTPKFNRYEQVPTSVAVHNA